MKYSLTLEEFENGTQTEEWKEAIKSAPTTVIADGVITFEIVTQKAVNPIGELRQKIERITQPRVTIRQPCGGCSRAHREQGKK